MLNRKKSQHKLGILTKEKSMVVSITTWTKDKMIIFGNKFLFDAD